MKKRIVYCCLLSILFSSVSFAQTDLETERKVVLKDALHRNFKIPQCGNSSFKSCLNQNDACPIALYLDRFLDWLLIKQSDYEKLYEQLSKRYESFTSTDVFIIDTTVVKWVGEETAPVKLEIYFSASCSHCRYILSELYQAVFDGELKGKARMTEIPFGANISNMAAMVANRYDKFWDLIFELNKTKVRIDTTNVYEILQSVGLSREQIDNGVADSLLKTKLLYCKEQAVANDVSVVPTIFINNHRYSSYKDPEWIIDAVKYEYEFGSR
ncbi:MAG: thioredoxin domain-containing protein [Fibrobacter sp.]|nr:thioredoxin domain-containing protein [Fibrobacter sp.]